MTTINSLGNGLSGVTGSGTVVGSTSPTIVTPKIAQINDVNGNATLVLGSTAGAVNSFEIQNASSSNGPVLEAVGSDSAITAIIQSKGDAGVTFQTSAVSGAGFVIYSGTSGRHSTNFYFNDTIATRSITYPDANGTVALTTAATTSWNPVFTFGTVGDLSVAYATRNGYYSQTGNTVTASVTLICTPTFTTSSGAMVISGLPFNANSSITTCTGAAYLSNITVSASALYYVSAIDGGFSTIGFTGVLSGTGGVSLSTTNFMSGTQVEISATLTYLI